MAKTTYHRYSYGDILNLPPMLKPDEAGKIMCLSAHAVRSHCVNGDIPAVKLGGVWRIDSIKLLQSLGLFDQVEVIRIVKKEHSELLEARKRIEQESHKTTSSAKEALEDFDWTGLIGE